MNQETIHSLGRVMRANTTGFIVGVRVLQPQLPSFGALLRARASGGVEILGLVYDVAIDDDLFIRQLLASPRLDTPQAETIIADQRQNRQVPAEVSVLSVAYRQGEALRYALPPQPPTLLDTVERCSDEEVKAFTANTDYFPLVLNAGGIVPADELLAASLREGARVRGLGGEDFLVKQGRELIRLLANDPVRLDNLLRRIRPAGNV